MGSVKGGITKNKQVEPAQPRDLHTFVWKGETISAYLSPGQVINKDRLYKKHRQAQGYNY
jgi:hypothetical protein